MMMSRGSQMSKTSSLKKHRGINVAHLSYNIKLASNFRSFWKVLKINILHQNYILLCTQVMWHACSTHTHALMFHTQKWYIPVLYYKTWWQSPDWLTLDKSFVTIVEVAVSVNESTNYKCLSCRSRSCMCRLVCSCYITCYCCMQFASWLGDGYVVNWLHIDL